MDRPGRRPDSGDRGHHHRARRHQRWLETFSDNVDILHDPLDDRYPSYRHHSHDYSRDLSTAHDDPADYRSSAHHSGADLTSDDLT